MKGLLKITLSIIIFGLGYTWSDGAQAVPAKFRLKSPAFRDGGWIPEIFSSAKPGSNLSPPLIWSDPPEGTKSFALIVEDLDIPLGFIFAHWVVYNIPAAQRELAEGFSTKGALTGGTLQGKNGYGQEHYLGPAPVWGTDRYRFSLYALDIKLPSDSRMNRRKLLKLMDGEILAQAELIGRYTKR